MKLTELHCNPNLPIIKPDYPGNPLKNGRFTNEDEDVAAGFGKVLRWQLTRNPQREEKKRDIFRLEAIENRRFSQTTEDVLVWLGHVTSFIRLNGMSLLTDPVFGSLPFINKIQKFSLDLKNVRSSIVSWSEASPQPQSVSLLAPALSQAEESCSGKCKEKPLGFTARLPQVFS